MSRCGHAPNSADPTHCYQCEQERFWQGDSTARNMMSPGPGRPGCVQDIGLGVEQGQLPSNVVAATPLYIQAQKGWLCPRCETVNAPWVPTCFSCTTTAAAKLGNVEEKKSAGDLDQQLQRSPDSDVLKEA